MMYTDSKWICQGLRNRNFKDQVSILGLIAYFWKWFFAYLVLTYMFVFQLWNINVSTFGDWRFCASCTDTGSPHMRMQWIWLPVCLRLQPSSTGGMCTCFFCKRFWVLWVQPNHEPCTLELSNICEAVETSEQVACNQLRWLLRDNGM
jgi:hypothetical protein